MVNSVNDQVRDTVYLALRRQRISQTALAEQLGISRQHLSSVLTGRVEGSADLWRSILDALGLEIIAREKEAER